MYPPKGLHNNIHSILSVVVAHGNNYIVIFKYKLSNNMLIPFIVKVSVLCYFPYENYINRSTLFIQ